MPMAGPGCRNASARVRRLVGERHYCRGGWMHGITTTATRCEPSTMGCPLFERSAHSLTNQYGGFRVRQHLVCHTAD